MQISHISINWFETNKLAYAKHSLIRGWWYSLHFTHGCNQPINKVGEAEVANWKQLPWPSNQSTREKWRRFIRTVSAWQVLIVLSCQVVLAMFHALWQLRQIMS